MSSEWETVLLGDLCKFTKGSSPTQKTLPGKYPLIVTGPEPLSSADYQFDGEAVCVPMVSSTGHGHASLKRVHYASGRFAVANIVTACEVKNPALFSTRFLHVYLQHFKDDLIVPRMQGTANVSLSQRELSQVPVSLPSLDEQLRILNLVGAVDDAIEAAGTEAQTARTVYASYLGLLGTTERLVPIADVVSRAQSGGTPSRKESDYFGGDIPWVKSGEVNQDGITASDECITEAGLRSSAAWLVPLGSTLVAMYGQGNTKGTAGLVASPVATNQAVLALVPDVSVIKPAYLLHAVRSRTQSLRNKAVGAAQPNLSKALILSEEIPVPSLARQVVITEALEALSDISEKCLRERNALNSLRTELLSALLSGGHRIPETYDELMGADSMETVGA